MRKANSQALGARSTNSCAKLPPLLSEPKARSRAPARRLCDGVRRKPADPGPPARSPEQSEGRRRVASFAEDGMVRFPKAYRPEDLHSKWRHGVGRHARQMRGEIVSTCKELRVRSKSRRVQTGQYPCLYQKFAPFLISSKMTETCLFMTEYDQLHILIERRTILSGQERTISADLDRMFLSGQDRLVRRRLPICRGVRMSS